MKDSSRWNEREKERKRGMKGRGMKEEKKRKEELNKRPRCLSSSSDFILFMVCFGHRKRIWSGCITK